MKIEMKLEQLRKIVEKALAERHESHALLQQVRHLDTLDQLVILSRVRVEAYQCQHPDCKEMREALE